jgi:hypothetical protein
LIRDIEDFGALEAFFRIIEQGLQGLADGEHFFELLADDVVFDFIISVPDYPAAWSAVTTSSSSIEDTAPRLPRPLPRPASTPVGFDFIGRARIRVPGQSRRHGLPVQQQIRLCDHPEGPQGVALARLS